MDKQSFKAFFEPYAQNVDQANGLAFWKLSDVLIKAIIQKHIPADLGEDKTILDAGGGTGRWVRDLSDIYKSKFVVYDLSEDMLAQAQKNIEKGGIQNRVRLVQGDLTDMRAIESDSIDHAVSIYSPISFIEAPEKAAAELYRILRKDGVLLIMGHGYYNAIASKINNYVAPADELERLDNQMKVKWAPHVPELGVFSKESMEKTFSAAGFKVVGTYGVPVFIQPGPEDFDPSNAKKSRVSQALENKEFFDKVFELEMRHNMRPEVANRGMNIFTVIQK